MLVKVNQLVVGGMYNFYYTKGLQHGGAMPLYLLSNTYEPPISNLYSLENFVVLESRFDSFAEEYSHKVLSSDGRVGYFCLTKGEVKAFGIKFKRLDKVEHEGR